MTERQRLEAKAIAEEIKPIEDVDRISCQAPKKLAWRFREYLQSENLIAEIFDNVMATERLTFSEVRFRSSLIDAQRLVNDFAIHLATLPEENVPNYWDGTLPPSLEPRDPKS